MLTTGAGAGYTILIDGGDGNDYLANNGGARTRILGQDGSDRIIGGTEEDELLGGAGNDDISAPAAHIEGGTGADLITVELGDTVIVVNEDPATSREDTLNLFVTPGDDEIEIAPADGGISCG